MKSYIFKIALLLFIFTNCSAKDKTSITVSNPTEADRTIETIEVEWETLVAKGFEAGQTIVLNAKGKEIPSQIIYDADEKAKCLIFQTQLKAKAEAKFSITKAQPAEYAPQVYAKMASERYNDFLWENNVIAFRIYHSDLIPVDGPSGGLDVWSKRTNELIIDTWLDHKDYHKDHGQGCDFYKVGPTLGAGGISLLEDGKMKKHTNYTSAKILAQGPIRLIVEFSFPQQTINGKTVATTKRLTFDANSSFNQFDVTYTTALENLPLVTGIVKRPQEGKMCMDEVNGCLMYWEPEHAPYGHQGLAIILPEAATMGTLENHLVAYSNARPNKPFTYYSGACWDKAGKYTTPMQWKTHINEYKQQLETPLQITVD